MSESPIEPTVGRIVLVRGGHVLAGEPKREIPGIVTRVWGRNCLNVVTFGGDNAHGEITSVTYDDNLDAEHPYAAWRWMPYQAQKAAESAA